MATYASFKRYETEGIVDGEVIAAKFADGAITTGKIANGAISSSILQNTMDFSGKTITYRAITNSDLNNSAAISESKFASGAAVSNLGYTPLNKTGGTINGDLILNGTNTFLSFNRTSDTGVDMQIRQNGENWEIREPEDGNKVMMSLADDGAVQFPLGLDPRYDSGWYTVNSDDRIFSSSHGMGRLPTFGRIIWYGTGTSTNHIHYWGSNFTTYGTNNDTDCFGWDSSTWRIRIDDDVTYKDFHSNTASNSNTGRYNRQSSGYGFKVLLW